MDGERFDRLAKDVSTAGRSRRGVLRGITGGTLAAFFGRISLDDAAAAPDNVCKGKPDLCRSQSQKALCSNSDTCACLTTVGGKKVCVELAEEVCPVEDECNSAEDCKGQNNACVVVSDCCEGRKRNLCVKKCGSGNNAAAGGARLPLLGR